MTPKTKQNPSWFRRLWKWLSELEIEESPLIAYWAAFNVVLMSFLTVYALLVALNMESIYLEVFYLLFFIAVLAGTSNLVLVVYYAANTP